MTEKFNGINYNIDPKLLILNADESYLDNNFDKDMLKASNDIDKILQEHILENKDNERI